MDLAKQLREYTRQLEWHLESMNRLEQCCCSISKTQCFVIVEIGRQPGISVKELAERMRIDKSGISRVVDELVKGGFVERKPLEKDRRCVTLNLLTKGQERFLKIESDMNQRFQEVLACIPEEKQEQVIESLRLYIEAYKCAEEQ